MDEQRKESFEEFRKSFLYGSRTDLLFKFLGGREMTDQDAAEFFRGLLEKLGVAFDTGDYSPVVQHCYEWQVRGYTPPPNAPAPFQYESTPWRPLPRPLRQCRVALVSAGGAYVDGDDPLGTNGMTQAEAIARIGEMVRGPAALASIPLDVDRRKIRIRHPGYDIRGAVKDYNAVFPIDRLQELQAEGVIGALAGVNYSFVGATSQKRLLAESAPEWAQRLKRDGVDATLLVAA